MTIGQLKGVLRDALEMIEDEYEDGQTVNLESNTYFVNGAKYFLGVSGYDGGYCDLQNLKVAYDDDHCDECGGEIEWNEDGSEGICKKCGAEF